MPHIQESTGVLMKLSMKGSLPRIHLHPWRALHAPRAVGTGVHAAPVQSIDADSTLCLPVMNTQYSAVKTLLIVDPPEFRHDGFPCLPSASATTLLRYLGPFVRQPQALSEAWHTPHCLFPPPAMQCKRSLVPVPRRSRVPPGVACPAATCVPA